MNFYFKLIRNEDAKGNFFIDGGRKFEFHESSESEFKNPGKYFKLKQTDHGYDYKVSMDGYVDPFYFEVRDVSKISEGLWKQSILLQMKKDRNRKISIILD